MADNIRGLSVLLDVNTGTIEAPVWTELQEQGDASLDASAGTVDVTTKTSKGFKPKLTTLGEWSVSVNINEHKPFNDAAFKKLQDAYFAVADALKYVQIRLRVPSGYTNYVGLCMVSAWPLEAPTEGIATKAVTLEGSDVLYINNTGIESVIDPRYTIAQAEAGGSIGTIVAGSLAITTAVTVAEFLANIVENDAQTRIVTTSGDVTKSGTDNMADGDKLKVTAGTGDECVYTITVTAP